MLKLKPFKQSPSYCGPASLKMVLAYYGVEESEKKLGELCHTTLRRGTTWQSLVRVAKRYGLGAEMKRRASLRDIENSIKKGAPVIVNWFSVNEGHWSVIIGIDSVNIYMLDPEIGKLRSMSRKDFMRVWFDFRSDYITNPNKLFLRLMVVIKSF